MQHRELKRQRSSTLPLPGQYGSSNDWTDLFGEPRRLRQNRFSSYLDFLDPEAVSQDTVSGNGHFVL